MPLIDDVPYVVFYWLIFYNSYNQYNYLVFYLMGLYIHYLDKNTLNNTLDNIFIDDYKLNIKIDTTLSLSKQCVVIAYEMGYRIIDNKLYKNEKFVSNGYNSKGYLKFAVFHPLLQKLKNVHFHRLLAYEKYGNTWLYSKLLIRHLNGISTDNSWDNIALGTHKDNYDDISIDKRKDIGHNISIANTKINSEEFSTIISMRNNNMSLKNIAEKYNVSITSIWRILKSVKIVNGSTN